MKHRQRHINSVKDDLKKFGNENRTFDKKVLQKLKTVSDRDYVFWRKVVHIVGWNNDWYNNKRELQYYCTVRRKQQFYNILEDLIVNGYGEFHNCIKNGNKYSVRDIEVQKT